MLKALQAATSRQGQTVQSLRNIAIDVMVEALNKYGSEAVNLSAELFNDVMEIEGLSVRAQVRHGVIAMEEVERIAHYQATKILSNNLDGFMEQVASSTAFLTRQAANGTMMAQSSFMQYNGGWHYSNAQHRAIWSYSSNGAGGEYQIRYARVPQGLETCDFCLMLASRGFVYLTAESAEGWNHTHRGCDCIVVAGVVRKESGKWVQQTQLEGYDLSDLNELHNQWGDRARDDEEGRRDDMEAVLGRREW